LERWLREGGAFVASGKSRVSLPRDLCGEMHRVEAAFHHCDPGRRIGAGRVFAGCEFVMATRELGALSLVVRDYDEAIEWYTRCLGFELIEDRDEGRKRWVTIAPSRDAETRLLLAQASTTEQAAAIGNQGGGRVFLFLHTDDFARDHAHMLAQGVKFHEAPRYEAYGTVAVFEDLYGNKWDLLQPR
jgi:catechol 2,3-dioxygenase-like lactoylglutathione lyase family enzyme